MSLMDYRIHPVGPIQSLVCGKRLSETMDICDFRVAHDNGGRDAVAAADDDDDGDVGAAFDQNYVGEDDE